MGWTYCREWTTREKAITAIRADMLVPYTILADALTPECWWVVASSESTGVFLVVFLLEKHAGEWGFKEIEEAAGPFASDCPKHLLDMVPPVNAEFRARCAAR